MIRPIMPDDITALLALTVASGLFPSDELEELRQMLSDHFKSDADSEHFWITDEAGGDLISVAYYAPERMTNGTWNLYLIAVRPDSQGQGHGTALLRYVERMLTARGERLLLVETSGLASFERTRAFYRKCGYDEDARIRDFYEAGEDKIVFRKLLTAEGR